MRQNVRQRKHAAASADSKREAGIYNGGTCDAGKNQAPIHAAAVVAGRTQGAERGDGKMYLVPLLLSEGRRDI